MTRCDDFKSFPLFFYFEDKDDDDSSERDRKDRKDDRKSSKERSSKDKVRIKANRSYPTFATCLNTAVFLSGVDGKKSKKSKRKYLKTKFRYKNLTVLLLSDSKY